MSKSKSRKEPSGVFEWMTGTSSSKQPTSGKTKTAKGAGRLLVPNFEHVNAGHRRPSSAEEWNKRLAFLEQDPLNVHQIILKHLQGKVRAPITSVYELANLITDTCVNLFDPYRASDDFQFFDFFERSIGDVVSKLVMLEVRTTLTEYRVIGKHNASNSLPKVYVIQDLIRPLTSVSHEKLR